VSRRALLIMLFFLIVTLHSLSVAVQKKGDKRITNRRSSMRKKPNGSVSKLTKILRKSSKNTLFSHQDETAPVLGKGGKLVFDEGQLRFLQGIGKRFAG